MSSIEKLLSDLRSEGAQIEELDDGERFVLTLYGGERQTPPITLYLSPEELDRHLEAIQSDAQAVYPHDSPRTAAYKLFLVHLDETILMRETDATEVRLIKGDIKAVPPMTGGTGTAHTD